VEVLDALDTGMLRLVSRGEGEPVTQAFRLCADGEPQEFVDGCVVLTRLDENGIPTNSATPARIRFTQITQTFPAWSVAIVQEDDDGDIDGIVDSFDNCLLVPNGPSHTDAGGHSQRDTDDDGFGNLCDADLNGTGLVTAADFNLLRSCLNQSAGSSALCAAADMNGSGLVTTADFSLLRPRLNTAPGPSGLHN
jgi:hypothetical protein